jgi:RNA polymerase sigma-70 factor (ECF subfamily)
LNDSGRDLMRRVCAGDVAALLMLYDRYAKLVSALANRIVRNPADSEDVVQETFLQAWQQARRFDSGRGSVEAWLLTIARTRALDRVRRTAVRTRHEDALTRLARRRPAAAWVPDRDSIRAEKGRELRRGLAALPAHERIAVELSFYQGLTHVEIADVLSQPLGTIKTRIRLGIQKMRDGMQPAAAVILRRPAESSPFTVALAEYLARRPVLAAPYRSLHGVRALVIDDDDETVDLVTTVMQSAGASVVAARSTTEGLAHLDRVWPDVILSDIVMPRHDGYVLIREARALAEASGRRLTAIAFTALGHREHEKALRAGFATLVPKPVQPHALLEVVVTLTRRAA